jgi:arylsulfatase A-like enzyme
MSKRFHGTVFNLAVCLLAAACTSPPESGPKRWNVLLVTLDTTRADHLGCYGHPVDTSPNLDALAADAVRFEFAISTSAVTPMSHASIFTGLNPDGHGLRVFHGGAGHFLDRSVPTLASVLHSRGWRTAAFISAYPASERFGLHHGFETFDSGVAESVMTGDPGKRRPREGYWLRQETALAQRRADATTERALAWLESHPSGGEPFFLWVHYFDPHDPQLVPPEAITDRFGVSPNDPDAWKAIYDPEIFFMDGKFGRLMRHLKNAERYDETIIVAVADHGQGLGDHGWFPHRLLYQEQIRVPLIVRVPGRETGVVVPDLVRTIDILPTVADALGIPTPGSVHGSSLMDLMSGHREQARIGFAEALNTLDTHAPGNLPPHQRDLLFCAMDRTWKLIHHVNEPRNDELYDLVEDPGELTNLATVNPGERERLLTALKRSGIMNIERVEPSGPLDPEDLEKLRSLGYVN